LGAKRYRGKNRDYIQFGCTQWFWEKAVNSHVLQVKPLLYKDQDIISIDCYRAMCLQETRNIFMMKLQRLTEKQIQSP